MNVTVAWEDVIAVIRQISGYLVVAGIALAAMIAAMVLAARAKKPKRGLIRGTSVLAFALVALMIVNAVCMGPERDLLNNAAAQMGTPAEETVENSKAVVERVASEGIILAKNEDAVLPLTDTKNLNVFGWASTNPIYGGSGSGSVDPSTAVSLLGGLENAGFQLNTELSDMYTAYRDARGAITINDGQDWTLPEPTADSYTQELLDNAKAFSDTALLVLARPGGEGADLPQDMGAVLDGSYNTVGMRKYIAASYTNNGDYDDFEKGESYLELSATEKDLVDLVCDNFENVIVVYNGANTFEMGWTEDYGQIKGVLLAASPGATGFNALGKILSGEVNPSGRTVDTWLKDLTASNHYNNIGANYYTNVSEITDAAKAAAENADGVVSFVNYAEGIYVGYRYYETASAEAENGFDFDYDKTVMYPFGYGLSYTSFQQEMGELEVSDGTISVDVTVTNTGEQPGKDVVQVYYTPPYKNGGVEKAEVNLAGFGKTGILEPGAAETVTVTFDVEDMASYDTYGKKAFVLERGSYGISLRGNSHEVIDTKNYKVDQDIVYDGENPHNGDAVAATNRLADFSEGDIMYLSRADAFANYEAATAAPRDFELHAEVTANGTYNEQDYNEASDEMPKTGERNGLTLMDLRGADYEDPRWDELLDQATVEDMVNLIANSGFATPKADSIGKILTHDTDGPAGVNSFMMQTFGIGYCGEVLLAQTYNVELASELGDGICRELSEYGYNGWYAPSMNLHRNTFGGRNFEYYSEDQTLSARMAVAECAAAYPYGIYPYIKHLAFNEQETNRNAILCTWITEQSARELYLKPFEECVKANTENSAMAVMSSYVYVGNQWDGGCDALLNGILREEWGYRGLVLTDYFGGYGYMDADKAIRGGSDAMLGTIGGEAILTDQSSATSVIAMRQAVKNLCYTVVNSNAYSEENYEAATAMPRWQRTLYTVDAILAILIVLLAVLLVRSYRRKLQGAGGQK